MLIVCNRYAGLAAIFVFLAVAGCSSGPPVQPWRPAGSAVTTMVASEPTTTPRPARPRELRLDGKDPCATVPKSEWATFSIDLAKPELDPTFRSPSCFFNSSKAAMGVVLVVTEGIEAWAPGKRVSTPANVAPIQGFPAISLLRPAGRTDCAVAVDVAQGQYLMADVVIDLNDVANLPDPCTYAHQFAEVAIGTLLGG